MRVQQPLDGMSKMAADRLQFLSGLQALLFQPESRRSSKGRNQLHKMLEGETWIFGEEYFLTTGDEILNALLRKHLAKLRPSERKCATQALAVRDDGSEAVIDLLLGRETPAYANDERFDKNNNFWTFIAISNEISEDAARTVRQPGKPVGFFHNENNLRIGLATWGEILGASRTRLEAFREKLGYTATRDQGVARLHTKYASYLADSFRTSSDA